MVYRYSYPKNYDSNNKYPLTIVLHGSDDQGDDNEIQMDIGLRWRTNADYYGHNEFTIVPQLLYWTPEDILNLIKYIREIGSIDTNNFNRLVDGWICPM